MPGGEGLGSVRVLVALAVAFVLLATTGWTAVRPHGPRDARTAAVDAWRRATFAGHRMPDPDSAPPGVVARFFATLTRPQALGLARRYALVVGNLDGAPVALRYQANRYALSTARDRERARSSSSVLSPAGREEAGRLANRYASLLRGGRQILAFDPAGGGRAAEVLGDLATASRVAVVVPGVGTDILTFERTYGRYSAPAGMARALYRRERALAPAARVAVIAWADWTAPGGIGLDASNAELAERGAPRLLRLLAALPRGLHVALFCHSYGSVLCGVAAPRLRPGQVTDIAVSGSPGMHVGRASDLHTSARVWAARDDGDWIADVPHIEFAGLGHGTDPVAEGFGATVVRTGRAEGHAGYFVPGTASLANFARIALARYSSVTLADERPSA
ncbi:alpha/beta hydrolase [Streptomyces sp. NRRL F-5123]|uniref:alpha/beta hydrolase n=1 Tax=Streptomyces sp. NRRL F-5123 TaxID=1463856 RepID=UPI0004E22C68|nr:alpha/beta hydrolase [Streptomyces sp. NRRL F-5123]